MDHFLTSSNSLMRLVDEYYTHPQLVIGFDFDHTVHDYHNQGHDYTCVISLLRELKDIGCKLICWTAHRDHVYVKEYLKKHSIPFDDVNTDGVVLGWESRKPFFNALLDDRSGLAQVYDELSSLVKI